MIETAPPGLVAWQKRGAARKSLRQHECSKRPGLPKPLLIHRILGATWQRKVSKNVT